MFTRFIFSSILVLIPALARSQGYVFTTIAGSAPDLNTSYVDGAVGSARFNFPHGIAVDTQGNIFVADTDNHAIRKISGGVVTTIAGGDTRFPGALVNGQGRAARFYSPSGVAVDRDGNLYVADTQNNAIRKITPSGLVSTFAGGGKGVFIPPKSLLEPGYYDNSGSADGSGEAAQFNGPCGVAVAPDGSVYVADNFNNTIRKISPGGQVTTFAGSPGSFGGGNANGKGANARFFDPTGVAVDRFGNVFVADSGNCAIREITPDGVVTTLAGSRLFQIPFPDRGHVDGDALVARFNYPSSVAVGGDGSVYVADSENHTIRKISVDGQVSTIGGVPGMSVHTDGVGSAAIFGQVLGIAADSNGNVYIAETSPGTIRKGSPPPPGSPTISNEPSNQQVVAGGRAMFSVTADGAGLTYQWEKDGAIIPGATGASYQIPNVTSEDTAGYAVIVTNALGAMTSTPASLVVSPLIPASRPVALGQVKLINISTRSYVGTDAGVEIAGFIIGGSTAKTILIRAAGPALKQFGVTTALEDPTLELHSATRLIKTNDNWGDDSTEKGQVLAATGVAGAWAWPDGSRDSAMVATLNPGSYTAVVAGKYKTVGTALIELYEVDLANDGAKLVNLSTRSLVQTGEQVQIAGFIVAGPSSKTVVIRASGPALKKYQVAGFLADPVLEIHDGTTAVLSTNDNWNEGLRPDFQALGVDNWDAGSNDAAVKLTLAPGSYTAVVSGKNGGTGVSLVEILESN